MCEFVVRPDLESVTDVMSYDQVTPGKPEYGEGREPFMGGLLALLAGLRKGGADTVVVYDQHCLGRNADLRRLPGGVSVICGKLPYRPDWAGALAASTRGLVLLGLHSRRGTPGGLLDHSYDLDTCEIRLNGLAVGEIGVEAAIAADLSVPMVLVTDDSAGIAEARALVSGVAGVAVKESVGHRAALCHPASLTSRWIEEAAERAAACPPGAPPSRMSSPVTLEVDLEAGPLLRALRRRAPRRLFAPDTLRFRSGSVLEAWSEHLRLKEEAGC